MGAPVSLPSACVKRRSRKTRETRAKAREEISRLAPSVTRVVIFVSQAFCSTDQEKRETARSLVISGKVYVAWKREMLHDVTLHDVTGGHQAYIHRKKDLFMAHRILHLAKTTCGSRDARATRL